MYNLQSFTLRLAENVTGSPFSFGLFSKKKDPTFFLAPTHTDMVEWVTALRSRCYDVDLKWNPDTILEAFNEAVVMASMSGTIVSVNEAAVQLFGYTKNEMMGMPVSKRFKRILTPPIRKPYASKLWKRAR